MILLVLLEKQAHPALISLSRGGEGPLLASLGQRNVVLGQRNVVLKPHQYPPEIGTMPNRDIR